MKSRRVRRVRAAEEHARGVLATYRASSRGLLRVLTALSAGRGEGPADAAARAAHHLAELEARLPGVRKAIRSCRYPRATSGDPAAVVWGLWGSLADCAGHIGAAVKELERLGRALRPSDAVSSRSKGGRASSDARGRRAKRAGTGRRGPAGSSESKRRGGGSKGRRALGR